MGPLTNYCHWLNLALIVADFCAAFTDRAGEFCMEDTPSQLSLFQGHFAEISKRNTLGIELENMG